MNAKKVITIALLLFVAASAGILALRGVNQSRVSDTPAGAPVPAPGTPQTTAAVPGDEYVVYYFMTSQRCENCINFENYTTEVMNTAFSDPVQEKKLSWEMINLDEPQNRHYIKEYSLITKSIILVHYRNGIQADWKNLDQIWNLVGDKAAFQNYISGEMKSFLGAQG